MVNNKNGVCSSTGIKEFKSKKWIWLPMTQSSFFRNSGEEGKLGRKLSRIGSRGQREPPRPPPHAERPPPATPPKQPETAPKLLEVTAKSLEPSPKQQTVCPKPPEPCLKPSIPPKPHIQVFSSTEHGNDILKVKITID